jgi:hypothetical protein
MKTRRDKVEEIKKKTNYYSTRDLLQKYDESSPSGTPSRQRLPPGQYASTPKGQTIPNNGKIVPQTPAPSSSGLQSHLSRMSFLVLPLFVSKYLTAMTPSYPIAPPRKQWYDKLADAILGEDDPSFVSPSARYALICEKCFNHNGLVKESMWEDARTFVHWNMSIQSLNFIPRIRLPQMRPL